VIVTVGNLSRSGWVVGAWPARGRGTHGRRGGQPWHAGWSPPGLACWAWPQRSLAARQFGSRAERPVRDCTRTDRSPPVRCRGFRCGVPLVCGCWWPTTPSRSSLTWTAESSSRSSAWPPRTTARSTWSRWVRTRWWSRVGTVGERLRPGFVGVPGAPRQYGGDPAGGRLRCRVRQGWSGCLAARQAGQDPVPPRPGRAGRPATTAHAAGALRGGPHRRAPCRAAGPCRSVGDRRWPYSGLATADGAFRRLPQVVDGVAGEALVLSTVEPGRLIAPTWAAGSATGSAGRAGATTMSWA